MYTLFLLIRRGAFVAIVPTFFGVSSNWIVLPGMILGFVTFLVKQTRVEARRSGHAESGPRDG